jgi:hypothetical protein
VKILSIISALGPFAVISSLAARSLAISSPIQRGNSTDICFTARSARIMAILRAWLASPGLAARAASLLSISMISYSGHCNGVELAALRVMLRGVRLFFFIIVSCASCAKESKYPETLQPGICT